LLLIYFQIKKHHASIDFIRFAHVFDFIPFLLTSRSRIYFDNYVRDRCREEINNSYYSIPQQQQSVATSTSDTEQNNSSLVIPNPTNNIQIHPTSLSSCSTTSGTSNHQQQTIAPSVLYTVQRVVSTSQLQQLTPNYGNNSNPSNLTNVISRNDTDCGKFLLKL
jgi:hypothetical protein